MPSENLRDLIHALPKVELHVHLVGSAGVDTVLDLARRHPEAGVPADRGRLTRLFAFRDFAHFLEVYWAVQSMLRDRHDIRVLVTGLAAELARQNVRYAEVTVTPYNHILDGMPGDELLAGLDEGRAIAATEYGVKLAWCFDIPGEKGLAAGRETVVFALRERGPRPRGAGAAGTQRRARLFPRHHKQVGAARRDRLRREPLRRTRAAGTRDSRVN